MQITSQNPHKGLFKLLIGQSVTEGIHGAISVAEKVGKHEDMAVDAGRSAAETFDQRQDMIGRPAGDERAQNERNSAQSLARPVLRL